MTTIPKKLNSPSRRFTTKKRSLASKRVKLPTTKNTIAASSDPPPTAVFSPVPYLPPIIQLDFPTITEPTLTSLLPAVSTFRSDTPTDPPVPNNPTSSFARQDEQSFLSCSVGEVGHNTTKDDMCRLLHLFKEPMAQVHWSKFHNSALFRREIDAVNAMDALVELFNNYTLFNPQYAMLEYRYVNGYSIRVTPYQVNSTEWEELVKSCLDLNPTNMVRKKFHRDGEWIESHWTDSRNTLHEVFESYNRSGQNDHGTVAWCSGGERERWRRNAESTNGNVHFPSVIVYSIALFNHI